METNVLIHRFQRLPGSARKELMDFLDFLTARYEKEKRKKNDRFSFEWGGVLKELNDTSVGLQHKANQWR